MAIPIEIEKGLSIYNAAQEAIKHAQKFNTDVEFFFNDILINVSPRSFDEDIVLIYALKQKISRLEHKT